MPELPVDKPEVVVESPITREEAEEVVSIIEKAAVDLDPFLNRGVAVDVLSKDGATTYRFMSSVSHDQNGTDRPGDDIKMSTMNVWKMDANGNFNRRNYLSLSTSRDISGKDLKTEIYLTEGNTQSLVAEVDCTNKRCTSKEGDLVQEKTNDLIQDLLRPQLDEMTSAEAARQAELKRIRDEEARAEEARKAEAARAKDPVIKAKNF